MAFRIVERCAKLLADKKLTIAFAESATAGRLASEFSLTPDSGSVLKGGIVCYDACIKEDILKVPHGLIARYTPESAEVTEELVIRFKKFMQADIHVAITGLTTPGGSETAEKPVGTMFIHIILHEKQLRFRGTFKGSPAMVIARTINKVGRLLIAELE